MAEVVVPFPVSASPGQFPGEGTGNLINVFAEKSGDELAWSRVPGLTLFANTGFTMPRGFLSANGVLYIVYKDKVVSVTSGGVVTSLANPIAGTGPVTMSVNNKAPTPDIVIVADGAAYIISGTSVLAYPDADILTGGSPNSVSRINAYFMFTYPNGRIMASEVNATDIHADSIATAEVSPDGLLRGIGYGSQWFAFGTATIQIYQDVGTSPFPLAPVTTIPVGLFGPWCVPSDFEGWDRELMFVAKDGTVRRLNGYTPEIVSTADVVTDINRLRFTPDLIRCSLYTFGANAIFCLSAPTWTWEYNLSSGAWNKRVSQNLPRWIGSESLLVFGKWMVGSWSDDRLFYLDEDNPLESTTEIVSVAESGSVKQFPRGVRVPSAFFDFSVGVGEGDLDPKVSISWSHDGGSTWASPIVRSLGQQGRASTRVEVGPLGTSTHHGCRFRWECSDPVRLTFRGALLPGIQEKKISKDAG